MAVIQNQPFEYGVVFDTSKIESKGFGFIKPDNGDQNIFYHINGLGNANSKNFKKGQAVAYTVGESRGKTVAENVQRD